MGKTPPDEPVLFLKAPSALCASGEPVVRPGGYERVDYEGELAVVMARRARRVSADQVLDYVLGYTCLNDITVRDLQKRDGQWARAKSFDGFCPVGPRIVAGLDPSNLRLVTRLNGRVVQDSSTSDLIFAVRDVLAFISQHMTLEPGDLITTGTPSGVGNLQPGDRVEVDIEGIGVLETPIIGQEQEVSS